MVFRKALGAGFWVAVMALGFALGPLLLRDASTRRTYCYSSTAYDPVRSEGGSDV